MRLDAETLLYAYTRGIFPMAHEDQIYWYDPDPRAILPLEAFHVPRSLARTMKKKPYELKVDSDFRRVMQLCAAPAPGREDTWISPEFVDAYTALHRQGYAHSVEAWDRGDLVGGLYGVSINGFFAGESMFSRATDASKICLVHLVRKLRGRGFQLLDVQFTTPHLAQFGVIEIPRRQYRQRLLQALRTKTHF